jgi:hypothetical protein
MKIRLLLFGAVFSASLGAYADTIDLYGGQSIRMGDDVVRCQAPQQVYCTCEQVFRSWGLFQYTNGEKRLLWGKHCGDAGEPACEDVQRLCGEQYRLHPGDCYGRIN